MSEMKNSEGISRRSFLGLSAGIATSAITMGSITSLVMAKNITKIDVKTILDEEYETDVLVIGSGMAGLFASVKAHDAGARVMMVSKGRLGSSGQTPFAKGILLLIKTKKK
jgi:ribulose 1,5-bisphosphate synthetase/thiazole synthase